MHDGPRLPLATATAAVATAARACMHAAATTVTVVTTGMTLHSYANTLNDLVRQFPDKMRMLMACATVVAIKGRKIVHTMRTSPRTTAAIALIGTPACNACGVDRFPSVL